MRRPPKALLLAFVAVCAAATLPVTAIVPARDEELVIAACVESLARQREIAQILVVNDQSSNGTADIVRKAMKAIPNLRLLEGVLPSLAAVPGIVARDHKGMAVTQRRSEEC